MPFLQLAKEVKGRCTMESQSGIKRIIYHDIQYLVAGYHLLIEGLPVEKADFLQCYKKFTDGATSNLAHQGFIRQLSLKYDEALFTRSETPELIYGTEIWELGLENDGTLRLESPPRFPNIVFAVRPDFSNGNFVIKETSLDSHPYQAAIIVLFSNWFANFGDLLLHAATIIWHGNAYAFIGTSGAGKSTLVEGFMEVPGIEILGEDQAVLRKIDDEYYVFGTPWHVDERKCSPNGARLRGMFFLNRYNQNDFTRTDPFDTYTRLVATSFIPLYRERVVVEKIHDRLLEVAQIVPAWEYAYHFDTDPLMAFLSILNN